MIILLALLLAALFLIAIVETAPLVRQKHWPELAAFLFLWGLSSFLAVAQFVGVNLPNSMRFFEKILP
ncbi:MAG: hypothetical protein GX167_05555 [Firmicutes bacterium]|nr:hypothetical protein [Bacillota bacterium]HHX75531.1 hypothetical protein [Bacillota bacterium]